MTNSEVAIDQAAISQISLKMRIKDLQNLIAKTYEEIRGLDTDLKKICGCVPGYAKSHGYLTEIGSPRYCTYHAPVLMN